MTKIDQSTRRGRLFVFFVGGLLIFGGVALGGMYLSNQRRLQFEAAQNGGVETSGVKEDANKDKKKVGSTNGQEKKPEDENKKPEETPKEGTPSNEGSESENGQESAGGGTATDDSTNNPGEEQLPTTGPSEGNPDELPATGPEMLWVVAVVGGLVVIYLSFEYRRSRLAFMRAALRR